MPDVITIGPLLLATDRVVAICAIALFFGLVALADKKGIGPAAGAATAAVLVGLVAARAGYVLTRWSSYADEPWSALAVWQGGFSVPNGIVAAVATMAVKLGRSRAMLAAGSALVISIAAWFAIEALLPVEKRRPFPSRMSLWTQQGQQLPMDSFRGRPFVVNLWATWCGPCRRELPMLARVASEDPKVPILLINQGERAETIAGFLGRERIGGEHVILDPSRDLSRALGIRGYPATAFVSADGTIVRLQLGELSRAALHDGIALATEPQ